MMFRVIQSSSKLLSQASSRAVVGASCRQSNKMILGSSEGRRVVVGNNNAICKIQRHYKSTKWEEQPGILEADSGNWATRTHHAMTTSLAILTPLYFMIPDSMTGGFISKLFGLALAANISAHSWIGMNYVATDYVPKFFPKSFLGPSRFFNIGLAAVTFLGMAQISFTSPGGIKGCIKGLWNPPTANSSKKEKEGEKK